MIDDDQNFKCGGKNCDKSTDQQEEDEGSLMDNIMEAIHVVDSATYVASASLTVSAFATLIALQ